MVKKYITPKELKEILGIGHNALYSLIHQPDFPLLRIGKLYRINTEDLDTYLKKQNVNAIRG